MKKDTENDLLLGDKLDSNVEYLKSVGALDYEVQTAREIVAGFDPAKLDEFNDGMIYRAYYAAKKCHTMTKGTISKCLRISQKLLEYYLKTYPKLGLAIQAGYMDAIDEMKESLVSKLYDSAMGQTVKNTTTTETYVRTDDGELIQTTQTVTTHENSIPPNVSAQLELLKRLDPAWVPKVQVDLNQEINYNFHVVEDVNVAVDYRKLSPQALQELLKSGKSDGPNMEAYIVEDTQKRCGCTNKDVELQEIEEDKPVIKRRGRPPKIKNNQEGETNNGNKKSNRGRKKKNDR